LPDQWKESIIVPVKDSYNLHSLISTNNSDAESRGNWLCSYTFESPLENPSIFSEVAFFLLTTVFGIRTSYVASACLPPFIYVYEMLSAIAP
jgi:hypothetical protein